VLVNPTVRQKKMRKASIIALVAAVICVGITGWKTYQMQIG